MEEVIKPTFAHEPVLQRLANGRWTLYSIGNTTSGSPPLTNCIGGYSPRDSHQLQGGQQRHEAREAEDAAKKGATRAVQEVQKQRQQKQQQVLVPSGKHARPPPLGFVGQVPVEIYMSKAGGGVGAHAEWSRLPIDINPYPSHNGDINPAPLIFPNGSAIMMWRGGDYWYDVHLAHAANFSEPKYNSSVTGSIFDSSMDAKSHGTEDPFMYE